MRSAAATSAAVRSPPPSSTRTPAGSDDAIAAIAVDWTGAPATAPSRSTTWIQRAPAAANERASEAEQFRDALGRRADLLDAANRCARALGSSLDVDEAFGAFIRELRGLIPFDRTAIILSEDGHVRVMATAGVLHDQVLRPGEALPPGALIDQVMSTGETVYRRDMSDHQHPEEVILVEIGLRSRVAAPIYEA